MGSEREKKVPLSQRAGIEEENGGDLDGELLEAKSANVPLFVSHINIAGVRRVLSHKLSSG